MPILETRIVQNVWHDQDRNMKAVSNNFGQEPGRDGNDSSECENGARTPPPPSEKSLRFASAVVEDDAFTARPAKEYGRIYHCEKIKPGGGEHVNNIRLPDLAPEFRPDNRRAQSRTHHGNAL